MAKRTRRDWLIDGGWAVALVGSMVLAYALSGWWDYMCEYVYYHWVGNACRNGSMTNVLSKDWMAQFLFFIWIVALVWGAWRLWKRSTGRLVAALCIALVVLWSPQARAIIELMMIN